jgi:hypothetical protein
LELTQAASHPSRSSWFCISVIVGGMAYSGPSFAFKRPLAGRVFLGRNALSEHADVPHGASFFSAVIAKPTETDDSAVLFAWKGSLTLVDSVPILTTGTKRVGCPMGLRTNGAGRSLLAERGVGRGDTLVGKGRRAGLRVCRAIVGSGQSAVGECKAKTIKRPIDDSGMKEIQW